MNTESNNKPAAPLPTLPDSQERLAELKNAEAFFKTFGDRDLEFRLFADNDTVTGAKFDRQIGRFPSLCQILIKANKRGLGVFFQPNANDGKGFKAGNITSATHFFVDLDGTPIENLGRLTLSPSALVTTSRGKYHAYWRVLDIPIAQFTAIQKRLVKLIGSDPSVIDLPRTMRAPGFLHQKDPNAKHLVKVEVREEPPIAFDVFMAALQEAEAIHCPAPPASAPPKAAPLRTDLNDADLARSEAALRFLIEGAHVDFGGYHDWHRIAIALKSTHGDGGFSLWHALSAGSAGYVDEDACRAKWASFGQTEGEPLTMGTYFALAQEAGWTPPAPSKAKGKGKNGKKESGPAPAVIIRDIALASDELWLDMQGRPHATFEAEGPGGKRIQLHARIDSAAYRTELCERYTLAVPDKVLSKEQLQNALILLSRAARNGPRHPAYLRSGKYDDTLYISLGDDEGRFVRVSADTIDIVTETPLRFIYRGEGMGALPVPQEGGTIADFQRHYNVSPEHVINLIAVQMVALFGADSFPICLIDGQHGTGKSTLGDMIVANVDPPAERKQGRCTFSTNERDLYILASNAVMPFFDNLSIVDQAASDWVCRLATGGTFRTRSLYTNDEEHAVYICRPVIATAIGSPTKRGDFLSRTIDATALPVDAYRTEKRVWQAFEHDCPKLFGFILKAIQCALRNLPAVEQAMEDGKYPGSRLSDFGAIIEAAAEVLGLKPGEFSERQRAAQHRLQAEAAMGNPLVLAIHDYFSRHSEKEDLEATARELLTIVADCYPAPKGWPHVNQVKRILLREAEGIAALGLKVEVINAAGHINRCRYRITRDDGFEASSKNGVPTKIPF